MDINTTTTILVLGVLCLVLIMGYFSTRIIDWIEKRKEKKFKNNLARFNFDLYKLKYKWIKRGEYKYAEGIELIIQSFNDPKGEADTEYGRALFEDK